MGRDLVLLKKTKPPGIEWGVYLKELGIEFGRDYADRLIRRVEGREKTPVKPKPAPGPSPEPDIEIVDQSEILPPAPPAMAEDVRSAKRKIAALERENKELLRELADARNENLGLRLDLEKLKPPDRCPWEKDDGGRKGDARILFLDRAAVIIDCVVKFCLNRV